MLRATVAIVAAFVADASAFSTGPPRAVVPQRSQPLQMSISLPSIASLVNTGLYAAMGAVAGNGLVTKVPKLIGGEITAGVQIGDVAVDGVLFCVAAVQLAKMAGVIGKVDFAGLEGLPKSYSFEAGERALAGEVSALSKDGRYEVATFAGGCFWGTELHFQRIPGVIATCVGYTQGANDAPTYEQVCSGTTGHTEATQLIYDPEVVSYEQLCAKLFQTIAPDATALNRKGNDRGTQYRHGIYTHTPAQAEAAARAFESEQKMYGDAPIVTELKPATVFWPAEGYHRALLLLACRRDEHNYARAHTARMAYKCANADDSHARCVWLRRALSRKGRTECGQE